ncbi:hypothetical protein FF2_029156 [Malus domestica]
MDHCLAFSTLKLRITTSFAPSRPAVQSQTANRFFRLLTVVAGAGASHYEFSSLNSPLDQQTRLGKDLCTILQNHPQLFHLAVTQELKKLADDRELALSCASLSIASHKAYLHRIRYGSASMVMNLGMSGGFCKWELQRGKGEGRGSGFRFF